MNIVIYLYNGLTVLDAVGPYEVLSRLLSDFGAIPSNERYVQEGKIITAQGVSAGIDMNHF